jgi:hypothetical protein
MELEEHGSNKSWRPIGKLVIPIGIGLLLLMLWMLGTYAILPARAATSTLYVDKATGSNGGMNDCLDNSNPCLTIQYALNQAGNGDIIQVAEGTYSGTLNIAITVTLKGGYDAADWSRDIDMHLTKIDADGAAAPVIGITPSSDFMIEGFTIEGSENSSDTGGGFLINDATVLISATVVQDNEASEGGGVWVEGDNADVWIQNSSLLNNQAENNGGGLHNSGWGKVTLINSVVQGNDAPLGGGGIQANTIILTDTQVVSNTSASSGAGINSFYASIYRSKIGNNTVTGEDHTHGGGIAVIQGSLYLENSEVFNNSAVSTGTLGISGGSALLVQMADATILNTVISDNKDGGNTVAVFSSPFTFTNVMVVNNDGDGIASDDGVMTGTLTNVTIAGNGFQGISMNEDPATDVSLTNSILWNNGGIDNNCGTSCSITYSIIGTGDTSGEGNFSADPRFVDPDSGDYHLQAWSPAIDIGNDAGAPDVDYEGDSRPQNDGYDLGADEFVGTPISSMGIRYVATTGSDASNPCVEPDKPCQTVAYALDLAEPGESVLIAAGTYTENLELVKTLTIRGGYTISGTEWLTDTGETIIDGNSAGRVFFIHDNNSTIEYLTITGGKASDPECWGGGMWVTNGDVTVRNSTIKQNLGCGGAGIELNTDYGPVNLTIRDSIIKDNSTNGGQGGAMNTSGNVRASYTNVLITGNESQVGSVFSMDGGDLTVINSTIANNQADQAVLLWRGAITMTNSIMYENALNFQGDPPCPDCFVVSYSNIQGYGTGTGNIDEDPMFVDAASGDYSLLYGSPCIDSGTDSGAPDHDLVGTVRPLDGDGDGNKVTDMGSYEFLLYQLYLPYTLKETGS